jgi:hypothetical protein
MNPHLAPHEQDTIIQSEIIGNEIDFILRFENLDQDFKQLCFRIGMDARELPTFGAQSGRVGERNRHYSSYYDSDLRDIVAKRHAVDIARFGYEFEDASPHER